nr:LOW QUALITY PROTEIN: transient receptor potential cation channel subfamily M member 5 [Loxodonta africana]
MAAQLRSCSALLRPVGHTAEALVSRPRVLTASTNPESSGCKESLSRGLLGEAEVGEGLSTLSRSQAGGHPQVGGEGVPPVTKGLRRTGLARTVKSPRSAQPAGPGTAGLAGRKDFGLSSLPRPIVPAQALSRCPLSCVNREAPMEGTQGPGASSPRDAGDRWGPSLCRGELDFGGSGNKRGKCTPGGPRRHVGQAVRDHLLASTSAKVRVVAIGIAPLGRVLHRQLLDAAQPVLEAGRQQWTDRQMDRETDGGLQAQWGDKGRHSSPLWAQGDTPVYYPEDNGDSQGPLCRLDNNHSHFILVGPGDPGASSCGASDGPTELQLRLEKYISEQRTGYGGTSSIEIPVLCLLVNGDPSTLERISRALAQAAPWLILAGSGGIADVLAALMNQPHLLVPQVAEKQFKEKFPSEHFSWEDIMHWTRLLQTITAHPHLLTVYNFEQEGSEELDTVILKALVKACKSHSQQAQNYLDELKLAVAWDCVDVAKSEIFNGDVEWKVPIPSLYPEPPFLAHEVWRPGAGGVLEGGLGSSVLSSGPVLARCLEPGGVPASDSISQGQEGVATALAACKILKEMSHLETETEVARTMREAKYEQLALELFSECYSNSEDRAFALLVRRNHSWGKTTCLHLATEADAKVFFAHDGVQAFLTRIWWGDMATGTPILRLLGAFVCPALLYTTLISFSEEAPLRAGPEALQELDSLDTERSLLSNPSSRVGQLEEAHRGLCGHRGPQATFLLTRWRKFWGAPVTVFLGNVVMYFAFLFLFTYVLLVDFQPPPPGVLGARGHSLLWVLHWCWEEIRQGFFTDEDMYLVKKFTLYVEDNWNKCDMVAIFLFVIGVTCRVLPSVFEAGRAVLAIDFMVFTLRLIHIFAVHKQLGPKIIIVERMMKDVFFFLFFLSVWLVAYGVTTQALLHPHDGRLEWIFRRVLYRPYLQIFGQIPLDEIDGGRVNCSTHPLMLEDSPSCPNLYANWLVILLLVTFLLVTNVLLMNLLIAMFSYTFQVVQGNADTFWKSQRYSLIVEYHERPALAPPFIVLSHLSLLLKKAFRKGAEREGRCLERDLPDPLDQKIVTWEAVQKENFLSSLEKKRKDSTSEVLRKTAHRVDLVAKCLGGLHEQEKHIKGLESQVSWRPQVPFLPDGHVCMRPCGTHVWGPFHTMCPCGWDAERPSSGRRVGHSHPLSRDCTPGDTIPVPSAQPAWSLALCTLVLGLQPLAKSGLKGSRRPGRSLLPCEFWAPWMPAAGLCGATCVHPGPLGRPPHTFLRLSQLLRGFPPLPGSQNCGSGSLQPPAEHRGGPGSREDPEAGQPPPDT